VSLQFVRSRPCLSFSFLFGASNQPHAACCNARGLLYECVFDALLFSSSYQPVGKPVSHHVITRPAFSSLFWIIIPAILPTTMLGYYSTSASSMPSEFFLVVLIYWKPASYRSSLDLLLFGKTTHRSAAMLICFSFFLDRRACYSTYR
jgi:hypothetical protein